VTNNKNHFQNLGYCCINLTINENLSVKNKITTNRSMIRKTFLEKGIVGASKLALLNVLDLEKILAWNTQNNINIFRISSDMFPWASDYKLENLPDFDKILSSLRRSGEYATKHNMRLTFHPGPFNKLTSLEERIIKNTSRDLEIHGEIFDLMGLSRTPWNAINIHVGAHYNDKEKALNAFCKNFNKLNESVKTRLTVENDDKASLYCTIELAELNKTISTPIVFDYHHHKFCNQGQTENEALEMAMSTWPKNIIPLTHYSESMCDEGVKCIPQAHSNFIYKKINDYGHNIHLELEAKMKDLTLLQYRKQWR